MQHILTSIEEFENIKNNQKAFILCITDGTCSVGENIAPKLEKLIKDHFPKLKLYYSYTSDTPEISAQLSIFTVPTLLVYFDSKRYIQKSRTFSLQELATEIERYYTILF